jgi:hypothetical protein
MSVYTVVIPFGGPMTPNAVNKSRAEMEAIWRERLSVCRVTYQKAQAEFQATFQEHLNDIADGLSADPSFAIRQARQRETAALEEYMKVLRVFTDLFVYGKLPPEG